MTNTVTRLAALGFVLLATALTPLAKASEADKKTLIRTNEPIQYQGKVLAAGQSVIKLLDSNSDRNVVQIYNAYETKLEMTILAKTAYRLSPTGDTRLTFSEMPSGQAPILRTWFYPGDNSGLDFSATLTY
jgi:hypothetical protein